MFEIVISSNMETSNNEVWKLNICKSGWYQGHRPDLCNAIENDYGTKRTICLDCKKPLVEYDFLNHKWRIDKSKQKVVTQWQ